MTTTLRVFTVAFVSVAFPVLFVAAIDNYILPFIEYSPSTINACTTLNGYREGHERYCAQVRKDTGEKDTGMGFDCYYDDTLDHPQWIAAYNSGYPCGPEAAKAWAKAYN